ncbi:class I SAM-dependent methyltransferase [Streptomyces triticagri]|uniref:Class I SAM-dependent methyltransferase n=1 Tax=Streptomyces triticagri TaxID=2293568 RepID=A0A372M5S2_9ACTN|nr:class I SAM-dependent methyltransferase [Streptomyces triticagri]RFU85970.1 class I SAM-dependent methyltransferase [Streptomyces triticagri]
MATAQQHDDSHPAGDEARLWDERYAESRRVWSGEPNAVLAREAAKLTPGHALDLGCGEGGDAVWLAGRGWRVTATDVSRVALERAAAHAAEAGAADRIDWLRSNLSESFPEGSYDLVSAQFLYSPGELPREQVLRRATGAVAPGGHLLIESHAGFPDWETGHGRPDIDFPTPAETLASLQLAEDDWQVLICAEHDRTQTRPDGTPGTRTDHTVLVRRRGGRHAD